MRAGRRLVEDFLLPSLNDERYGDLLKWEDKEKQHFSIRWSHKNAAKWSYDDTQVFQDWDKMKGHYRPEIKGYYMQAKQRFRAALYKLNSVMKLKSEDKHVKVYQLVEKYPVGQDTRRRARDYINIKPRIMEEDSLIDEIQTCIPTSVIRYSQSYSYHPIKPRSHWPLSQAILLYPSPPGYPVQNQIKSEEECKCRSLPLVQENRVTSGLHPHSASNSPRTSSPDSSQQHFSRPEFSKEEFAAKLNLIPLQSTGSSFQPMKKFCIVPFESPVCTSSEAKPGSDELPKLEDSFPELLVSVKQENENGANIETSCKVRSVEKFEPCDSASNVTSNYEAGDNQSQEVPLSSKNPVSNIRKHFENISRKTTAGRHVPIQLIPEYSKSSVIPRRSENCHHDLIFLKSDDETNSITSNSNNQKCQSFESIPCFDGPLNLSMKPDNHYKSENPLCVH